MSVTYVTGYDWCGVIVNAYAVQYKPRSRLTVRKAKKYLSKQGSVKFVKSHVRVTIH